MATRNTNKLTPRIIAGLKAPGVYADGGNLYFKVRDGGAQYWFFRYKRGLKQADVGIGKYPAVSLAKARDKAGEFRSALARGVDPLAEKKKEAVPTFGQAADDYIEAMQASWSNAKHRWQWSHTLTVYAAPIRSLPVNKIATVNVLACLQPIWQAKPETAGRVRNRIEAVLDAATAKGHRTGENPARWRGHLQKLLPARKRLSRGHYKAMPFDDVPAFMPDLRSRDAMAARALEFLILTAARTGEVLGARWKEIDDNDALWNVPAERMKAGKAHRVPLSSQAQALLRSLRTLSKSPDDYIFPAARAGRSLSNMAMLNLLKKRMGQDCTAHGFRSAFRDWAGERTNFPREVAEAALAHVNSDQTEAAYRRGDALEKRRKMMEAWGQFVSVNKVGNNIVPLTRAK